MSEEEWTIEELADENFLQTSARMTVGKMNAAERAALFRALIAQAGGVEVEVRKHSYLGEPDQSEVSIPWDFPAGPALLLPMDGSE